MLLETGQQILKGHHSAQIYIVSKEKRSVFREVIVSVTLSKSVLFRTVSEIQLFHCTDEQHAMSSHELQSALMLDGGIFGNVLLY
jgi:hypothetical protein